MSKNNHSLVCEFLDWDSEFFGYRVGKIYKNKLNQHDITEIYEWSEKNRINCLYFLSDSSCINTNNLVFQNQFKLVDIRLTFSINLNNIVLIKNDSNHYVLREANEGDLVDMKNIAANSHTDSRFYYDCNFDDALCDRFYEEWVSNSFKGHADAVFVACLDNKLIGYITCHIKNNIGDIGLIAVNKNARGKKVGTSLVNYALRWFFEKNITKVNVVTQGRNISSQNMYLKCNFTIASQMLWYHKWFE